MKRDRHLLLMTSYGLAVLACLPGLFSLLQHGFDLGHIWMSWAPCLTLVWLVSALACFRKSLRAGLIAMIPIVPVLYLNWIPVLFLIAWPLCGHGGRCMDG